MNEAKINLDGQALATILKGSVAENARKIGVTRAHLNNILKGRRNPSLPLFLKILSTYNLNPNEILRTQG